MKLVSINMVYCLHQFHALKLFLWVGSLERSIPIFHFFYVNPQVVQRNSKFRCSNCLDTHFNISDISLRVIRSKNYNMRVSEKVFSLKH